MARRRSTRARSTPSTTNTTRNRRRARNADATPPALQWFSDHCVTTAEERYAQTPRLFIQTADTDLGDEKTEQQYAISETFYANLKDVMSTLEPDEAGGWEASPGMRLRFNEDFIRLSFKLDHPGGHGFLSSIVEYFTKDIGADTVRLSLEDLMAVMHWFHIDEPGGNDAHFCQHTALQTLQIQSDARDKRPGFSLDDIFSLPTKKRPPLPTADNEGDPMQHDSRPLIVHVPQVTDFLLDPAVGEMTELIRKSLAKLDRNRGCILVVGTDSEFRDVCPGMAMECQQLDCEYRLEEDDTVDRELAFGKFTPPWLARATPIHHESQRRLLDEDGPLFIMRRNLDYLKLVLRHRQSSSSMDTLPYSLWDFSTSQASDILSEKSLEIELVEAVAQVSRSKFDLSRIERAIIGSSSAQCLLTTWKDEDKMGAWNAMPDHVKKAIRTIEGADDGRYIHEKQLLGSIINPHTLTETWDDISLAPYTKASVDQIIKFDLGPSKAHHGLLKKRRPGNLLLYGPPGTGKTQLARIMAKEVKASMIHISAADIASKWIGETEKLIKALFTLARMLSPCIIFIDEADSLLASRSGDHNVWKHDMVNQFLQEIDGISQRAGQPFMILATNCPERIDHAALRRFVSKLYLGLPSYEARYRILANLLKDENTAPDLDLGHLADITSRYTGSDIQSVCFQAAQISEAELPTDPGHSSDYGKRVIDRSHFQRALGTVRPSTTGSSMTQLRQFAHDFDPPGEQAMSEEALEGFQRQPTTTSVSLPSLTEEVLGTIGHADAEVWADSEIRPEMVTIELASTIQSDAQSLGASTDNEGRPATTTTDSHSSNQERPSPTKPPHLKKMEILQLSHPSSEQDGSDQVGVADSESYRSMDEPQRLFKYQALQPGRNIRLLELLDDGSAGGKIKCALHNTSLTEQPLFTALSYVWNPPAPREDILLDGIPTSVTGSLAHALRWVRYHWRQVFTDRDASTFRIWVDAVCINQDDIGERNHQVSLMRDIYSQAELVLSSISIITKEIQLALKIYNEIYRVLTQSNPRVSFLEISTKTWLKRVPALCSEDEDVKEFPKNKAWQALVAFKGLPYWERVWIIQETVLARKLLLFCGECSSDFSHVSEISEILSLRDEGARGVTERSAPDGVAQSAWCPRCYERLVGSGSRPRKESEVSFGSEMIAQVKKDLRKHPMSIHILYSFAFLCEATDPRDLIYGLLSLSSLSVTVDYTKSVLEVYRDFFLEAIQVKKLPCGHDSMTIAFLILSQGYQRSDPKSPSWPSWLPNFSSSPNPSIHHTVIERNYIFDMLRETRMVEISGTTLVAAGARIVSITKAFKLHSSSNASFPNFSIDSHIADFLQDMVTRHAPGDMPVLQTIMRVLATNSQPLSTEMITFAFATFVSLISTVRKDTTWRLFFRALTPNFLPPFDEADPSEVLEWFLRNFAPEHEHLYDYEQLKVVSELFLLPPMPSASHKVNRLSWDLHDSHFRIAARPGMILFETRCGRPGLATGNATAGDIICHLEGILELVILRQIDGHFVFIGCCFILGMDGDELQRRLQVGEMEIERFGIH